MFEENFNFPMNIFLPKNVFDSSEISRNSFRLMKYNTEKNTETDLGYRKKNFQINVILYNFYD